MKKTLFLSFAIFLETQVALAQNVPGVGNIHNQSRISLGAGSQIIEDLPLEAGRSYCCSIESGKEPDEVSLSIRTPTFGVPDPVMESYSSIGDITPRISSGSASLTNIDNRRTITPLITGNYFLFFSNDSFVSSNAFKFNCMETTLYGGYNTNANPYNFLELSNLTNSPITGRIRGFNFDGTATVDTTFSISANSRQDFDLHTPAGANKYGSLIVTHNAPYGGLKGSVSQYSTSSGGLQLGATVPLKSRSQTF